jgi:hypothetical protein
LIQIVEILLDLLRQEGINAQGESFPQFSLGSSNVRVKFTPATRLRLSRKLTILCGRPTELGKSEKCVSPQLA